MRLILYSIALLLLTTCENDPFKGDVVSGFVTRGDLIIIPEVVEYFPEFNSYTITKEPKALVNLYYSMDSLEQGLGLYTDALEPDLDTVIFLQDLPARNYIISCKLDSVTKIESIFTTASAISYVYITFE